MLLDENNWELPDEFDVSTQYVPRRVRDVVLERDRYRCRRCGEEDFEKLALHHIEYRSHGGSNRPENLVTVCGKCHSKIHSKLMRVRRIDNAFYFDDKTHWRARARRN
jgi:5-methylcytosine-specific restriction endonuclease McrA